MWFFEAINTFRLVYLVKESSSMAFESSTSYAGGTLTVSYDPVTDQWFMRYTLPNGFSLTSKGYSPFSLGFNYGASYDYDDVTNQLAKIVVTATPGTVITDPASIAAWQIFADSGVNQRSEILELANAIDRLRKAEVTSTTPPPVTETGTGAAPPGGTAVVDKPATTTDPSKPLPLGNDIDDIYDPNLTPEQIASLSPGDRRARENFFIEEAGGTPNTEGLATVDADGTIVVTAARQQEQVEFQARKDWRVRLALSPEANYLYRAPNPGILAPLGPGPKGTDGVLFPYTPTISVAYAANYEASNIIHSNYRVYQYSNSSVDNVTITCDFTAQDDSEANYLLAVIHFFRSMTKMFYGQDENPRRGTPPPLCYLFGMGNFQFSGHPLAITNFSYNLPNDVDYIKTVSNSAEVSASPAQQNPSRLPPEVATGGTYPAPDFSSSQSELGETLVTWVPTKIQLAITCVPMMSRNQVSNNFSLRDYAEGKLLNGINRPGGGFW